MGPGPRQASLVDPRGTRGPSGPLRGRQGGEGPPQKTEWPRTCPVEGLTGREDLAPAGLEGLPPEGLEAR